MRTETRFPCPVCLGVKMEKIILSTDTTAAEQARKAKRVRRSDDDLVLDHCARCGGVWFEAGEVQRLRRCESELLWREVVRREAAQAMLCHSCRSPVDRQATSCSVCGWKVELDCPTCARPMEVSTRGGMHLDYCRHCRGVWFDHDELTGIWKMELGAAVSRRRASLGETAAAGGDTLLDVLMFDPFLMYYGLSAGAHVAGAAAEGLAHAAGGSAGAIGEAAGAVGEAASGVFEAIVEIISGIFG